MVKTITPININDVLNEVMSKLDESEMILGSPSCSTDSVGTFRNEALNSIRKSKEVIEYLIHNSYKLQ